jgi:hypothetical protein
LKNLPGSRRVDRSLQLHRSIETWGKEYYLEIAILVGDAAAIVQVYRREAFDKKFLAPRSSHRWFSNGAGTFLRRAVAEFLGRVTF